MRALVLHNPAAGSGNIPAEEVLAALAAGGIAGRYCSTKAPGFPDALREPADLVVVAGGDGTVVKAIEHLRDRNVAIAILPLGSANNIARSLGIETDPLGIARADWQLTEGRRLDIGTAAGLWGRRLFVEAVGIGVIAEAAAATDEKGVEGSQASRLARELLCEMLAKAEPERGRFRIDGQEIEIQFLLAEIMNIASIGPRLSLAPAAEPGDGLLDLVYLEAEARTQMLVWLETRSQDAPPLTVRRGRSFAFEWGPRRLHVDDAFPTPPTSPSPVAIEIAPQPMTVLMPADIGFGR
jgi:diacylglycerol kinase (ATP)